MKILPRIALLFCLCSLCQARQAFGQTRLKVSPQSDTAGLPGATVSLLKNGKTVYAAVTDVAGIVQLDVDAPYVLRVNCLGFKEHSDTIKHAQEFMLVKLEGLQQLQDVVVTAQYTPGDIDRSTYRIKVIDAGKISRLAAVNLKDALSNELNFRFTQDNALGQSSLGLQGISGENVKVLIDGVPMIGRQNGSLDLSQINVNNVERIEIVEGPLSVNYGTNALAGVINIITKKPVKQKLEAGGQAYCETNHTYNANAWVGYGRRNSIFKINGGRNYFDGWKQGESFYLFPRQTLADTNRTKSWKPREQYFAGVDYGYSRNTLKLAYAASYFHETIISRGFPVKPYYETAFDDYYATQRLNNSLTLNKNLKKDYAFNTTLAYNYYRRDKHTYYKNLTDLSQQLAGDNSLQDTSIFTLAMARGSLVRSRPYETSNVEDKKINWFNYEAGYDLNYESTTDKRISGRRKDIGDYALFANSELRPFRSLVLRPGLRYAYNTNYKALLTPSFNVKYDAGKWIMRASYARGFRSPTLKELYFNFVDINHNIIGNKDLKAETSDNYSASFKYKRESGKSTVSFDQSWFYNNIDHLITLGLISGTQYAYINVGKYRTYGSSATASYHRNQLNVSGGGSYTAYYNNLSEAYSTVRRFSYSPELRASADYTVERIRTTFSAFYKYTGRLPGFSLDAEGNVYQSYINAFHMLDANVCRAFMGKKLRVTVGAKNIFNVTNVRSNYSGGVHSTSSTSSPVSMGRTYFIKLDYAFSK